MRSHVRNVCRKCRQSGALFFNYNYVRIGDNDSNEDGFIVFICVSVCIFVHGKKKRFSQWLWALITVIINSFKMRFKSNIFIFIIFIKSQEKRHFCNGAFSISASHLFFIIFQTQYNTISIFLLFPVAQFWWGSLLGLQHYKYPLVVLILLYGL